MTSKRSTLACAYVDPSRVRNVTQPWFGDAVELFSMSVRRHLLPGRNAVMRATPPASTSCASWPPPIEGGADWIQFAPRNIGQLAVAGKNLDDGYTLKMRIPYASLGIDATRLKTPIGFSVMIDDADVNGGSAVQYAWKLGYLGRDASLFGLAEADAAPTKLSYLRFFKPALQVLPGQRVLQAGAIVPSDAPTTLDKINLSLKWSAKRNGLAASEISAPTANATVNYPQFGARITRVTTELTSLRKGYYTCVAGMAGGAVTGGFTFDSVSWAKEAP